MRASNQVAGSFVFAVINSASVVVSDGILTNNGAINGAVTVANGATKEIGPFQMRHYNDASGYVQITYSAVNSVTVAAVKLAA